MSANLRETEASLAMSGSSNTTSQFRNNKGKLDTYSLAEQLLKDYHVIKIHNQLYIYVEGIYQHNMQELENAIFRLGRGAKIAEINTTLKYLAAMAPDREESTYEYVAFNNCVVNVKTLETFDFDYDRFVITSKVYASYDVEKLNIDVNSVQIVDTFFNDISCGDEELKHFLFAMICYCMLRTAKYQRAFILYGNANNGKSDFIHIIDKLLDKYCTHENLFQLSNLNSLKSIYHCTANIIDNVSAFNRVKFDTICSIITGGKLATKISGDEEFSFEPYATLLFATTRELDFSGCNDEIIRRFRVVPFNAKFDSTTVDRNMTEMITAPSCLDIIATRAIQAFSTINKEWEFPASVETKTIAYFSEGNPVLAFGKAYPIKRIITVDDYYRKYCIWHVNTYNVECSISIAIFGKRLSSLFNIKSVPHTIDGKSDTFYEGVGFNLEKFREEYKEYCNSLEDSSKAMSLLKYAEFLDKQDSK